MNKYLTEPEYHALQTRLVSDEASVTIPRNISRQFYMRVANRSVIETTGMTAYKHKLLIWGCEILAISFLALAGLLIIGTFGWWAAVVAPLAGIFWAVIAGLTNDEGELRTISIALALTAASTLVLPSDYSFPLLLVVLSLWIHRISFILAQKLLIELIQNSWAAYDMLAENVTIDDPHSAPGISS